MSYSAIRLTLDIRDYGGQMLTFVRVKHMFPAVLQVKKKKNIYKVQQKVCSADWMLEVYFEGLQLMQVILFVFST